jgi:hypothetical protein
MRVLFCLHGDPETPRLVTEALERRHAFDIERVDSFAQLWGRLAEPVMRLLPIDVVVVSPGPKQLSFAAFVTKWQRERPGAKLVVIGADAPPAPRIEPGPPGRLLDQLYAVLGLERSAVTDVRVVESVGLNGHVELDFVEWPGVREPLLRARVSPGDFDPEQLPLAQRLGQLAGPGIAPALECFWDDRSPHTVHVVPRGVPFAWLELSGWRPTEDDALAFVRELAVGVRTAHEAGASAGWLGGAGIWLGDDGAVSLVGVQLAQLPPPRPRTFGLPRDAPPEEFHTRLGPLPAADAFRLGIWLAWLIEQHDPLAHLRPPEYLEGGWPLRLGPKARARTEVAGLLETLIQPRDVHRPRGELLFELIDRLAPRDARARVAAAVAWARRQPRWRRA